MPMASEQEKVVNLTGSPQNPAREPTKRPPMGKGSIGDTTFKDAVVLVVLCWIALFLLYYSLRKHNV